ncbi:MAG: alpha/beta hydrolase fold protein, partial [Acidimicrobiales bacterium]|nr:alpha/beta hydrolase fold protein [Acidimicrobiales bacterium]
SGEPVLLLHGITGARSTWHDIAAAVAVDHRVFTLDHRGHGDSSHAPGTYDIEHWATDAIAVLERVVGRPAFVVGHSLGGVVAAEVIGRRPDLVRAALLEDPPLYLGDKATFDASPLAAVFGLMLAQFRAMRDRGASLDEYVAGTAAVPALNGAGTLGDVLGPEGTRRWAQATKDFDPEALADAISGTGLRAHDPTRPLTVPVHVLRAEPALFAAFRPDDEAAFLATNPHATVELVPAASHLIHDEQPALVLERIRALVDGTTSGA